jgi:preprotein translocase subunit SecA
MLTKLVRIFAGDPAKRTINKYAEVVDQVNALEAEFEGLSDEALSHKTVEFRQRLERGEALDDLLPEAFAAVREASKRTLGLRHFDVQLIGGIVLHEGSIAEMRTGEGKTLVATLPLYLNALTGKGTHLITVNDYLARRDARWNAPIFSLLGLSVGVLQMAARTENGKKAYLVDLERTSPHEDQHQLRMVFRREAYAADIVYGTNSEFGFDFLRDNMAMHLSDRVQRGHAYAIVDEVDNVLIDEARTPLIISGPASDDTAWYSRMAQIVRQLRPEDYEVSEKDRSVVLTELGEAHAEDLLGQPLSDPDRPEDLTPQQARLRGYLEQSLRAQFLFKKNKDYLVQGAGQSGKVMIVDEFTGRLMPGRRWSDGLHQAVEAKEGVRVQAENVTYATITIQNYFRMYAKLAGMSGTALTEAEEFSKIYKLEVIAIPTNLEYISTRPESNLVELDGKDEQGYKYRYYARTDGDKDEPVYWRRKDYPDVVYRTEEAKFRAIAQEILRSHAMGRPVLVGTTSVELSERLSARLRAEPLRRLAQVLVLRRAWFTRNNTSEDGRKVNELEYLDVPLDELSQSDMRRMARELEVSFTAWDEASLPFLFEALSLEEIYRDRLVACLQSGIPHNVLNARKHDEEGKIIAAAGALGAVTIATNMAGRGVDIRLGGELPEDTLQQVRLLLRRSDIAERMAKNGLPAIDFLPISQWPEALRLVDASELRSRAGAVDQFLNYVAVEERVRSLGGLHVIGSERHEARRIDNQLRGRAARQGDPGSSRFYLSMQDDLMRLFGGKQAEAVMQRMSFDETFPLEFGVVSRLVEQSQTRVEGANFDVRKHLLEYDDVLNSQRTRIYAQRDLIFSKDDLSDDVEEMLHTEVSRRVPDALQDEDGPWKLLAWLEQVQPTLTLGKIIFPSYTLRLLLDILQQQKVDMDDPQSISQALLEIARQSLVAEGQRLGHAVRDILENIHARLEQQLQEQEETIDTFLEGLEVEEEGQSARNPRELVDSLSAQLRLPLRLSTDQQRQLRTDPEGVIESLRPQLQDAARQQALTRLTGAIERRLEDSLDLHLAQMAVQDWDEIEDQVFAALDDNLNRRLERLVGDGNGFSGGQIGKDLSIQLSRMNGSFSQASLLQLLLLMPQGAQAGFDRKTHRRVVRRTTRLNYIYYAARQLEQRDPEQVAQDVLEHLENAQLAIRTYWGLAAWPHIATARWDDLEAWLQQRLENVLDDATRTALRTDPLNTLTGEALNQVVAEAGNKALTEIYRPLLLSVISELWVEYLTQMEALRVSIGLEAYAQRDPLVQYKSRASELFQNLFSSMRLGVVSRMFTYRPRSIPATALGLRRSDGAGADAELALESVEPEAALEALPEPEMPELPAEVEESQPEESDSEEEVAADAEGLSRSQKRRRRRR